MPSAGFRTFSSTKPFADQRRYVKRRGRIDNEVFYLLRRKQTCRTEWVLRGSCPDPGRGDNHVKKKSIIRSLSSYTFCSAVSFLRTDELAIDMRSMVRRVKPRTYRFGDEPGKGRIVRTGRLGNERVQPSSLGIATGRQTLRWPRCRPAYSGGCCKTPALIPPNAPRFEAARSVDKGLRRSEVRVRAWTPAAGTLGRKTKDPPPHDAQAGIVSISRQVSAFPYIDDGPQTVLSKKRSGNLPMALQRRRRDFLTTAREKASAAVGRVCIT
ncbi:hypothetical protein THAOC_07537 [Thalassiosira oceanica]|uniref:Uncharacterized protein n=1 Tax=Thalassiosira oceanica TaxID=159749 RepID=K0TC58_THAOC|nr:hypothetical protein THAOC_07537 [Thalassiosira oceanica]|eukprot:EJK71056.1 hypothetical protein THAOC_07537 [Thalassiosira oceanica]